MSEPSGDNQNALPVVTLYIDTKVMEKFLYFL
jgi:hypothetical protein